MDDIIFPKRVSKIIGTRIFKIKGAPIYGCEVEFENGDVIQEYKRRKYDLGEFQEGLFVEYVLHKKVEQKSDGTVKSKNRFKNYIVLQKDLIMSKPLIKYLDRIDPNRFIYLDIETVGREETLPKRGKFKKAWKYHIRNRLDSTEYQDIKEFYEDRSPLYPEFGKVACITMGYVRDDKLKVKSYCSKDEKDVLNDFITDLSKFYEKSQEYILTGVNLIKFDMKYIRKRCIANGIRVPDFIDFQGVKPWDMEEMVLDLTLLWGGDTFKPTSLSSLCWALDIPTPKQKIDGSMVHDEYHLEDNLEEIVTYCEQDVFACVNIMRRFYNNDLIEDFESNRIKDGTEK